MQSFEIRGEKINIFLHTEVLPIIRVIQLEIPTIVAVQGKCKHGQTRSGYFELMWLCVQKTRCVLDCWFSVPNFFLSRIQEVEAMV